MKKIGVVTVARSDYGIYRQLLKQIDLSPHLSLELFVGGMHLLEKFGNTISEIVDDGYEISARVDPLLVASSPGDISKSIGTLVSGFAEAYVASKPDMLIVLGDRTEMFAAVIAAVPLNIPIAHIHGGELTFGAIDDNMRHAITKLSHIHFVATKRSGQRLVKMGEQPGRVFKTGAPGLDDLAKVKSAPLSRRELEQAFNIKLEDKTLICTFHPETISSLSVADQITCLLDSLDRAALPTIFSLPNADTGSDLIIELLTKYVHDHDNAWLVPSFGHEAYFSLLCHVSAMIGNSSSGIIEAASFELPVVNIGNRQGGRERAPNVIDTPFDVGRIENAVQKAVSAEFRTSLVDMENPYGTGTAALKIVEVLENLGISPQLLMKEFYDADDASSEI